MIFVLKITEGINDSLFIGVIGWVNITFIHHQSTATLMVLFSTANFRFSLITDINFSYGIKVCMLGGESMKEKKTAAPFVVTFIFIGYASRNTRWDKTETHKASQWLARLYMF
ncbi:hypothetical protein E8L54_17325 [Escherichia coli]|nr:hypothetical protein [Escherichia coli]EEW0678726.1 hypothetical protein [Escherichia coli]EFB9259959.1 hypothetical protein [Escherichia coli]EFE8313741.1 hypothetical protein [Escherichia coli]EFI4066718.1 hypothetical protein [Escherichia coli]